MLLLELVSLCTRSFHLWHLQQTLLIVADATSADLWRRGWRNAAIPEKQLMFAITVQHLKLLLIIFLSDFFFLGLCIPYLHLSGLRDTIAICLYFSNPPCLDTTVWRLLGMCNTGCQFHYFSLYKHPHYSLPRSSHGMKYLHFNNALGRAVSPVCSAHRPLLKPKCRIRPGRLYYCSLELSLKRFLFAKP